MSIMVPSDSYIPIIAKDVYAYEFFKNVKLFSGALGASSPIAFDNMQILEQGGQYIDQPVLKPGSSALVTRRDYTSTSTVTPTSFTTRNDSGVRISLKSFAALGEDTGRIGSVSNERIAQHFAEETAKESLAYIQNHVIGAIMASLVNMTSALHTKTVWAAATRTNFSDSLMIQARALLGDKAEKLGCLILRSESEADLAINQLGTACAGVADMVVKSGTPATQGRPYIVVNDAALTVADAGFDKYYSLLLGAAYARIQMEAPRFYVSEQRLDTDNVTNLLRADLDFVLQIPSFTWDKTNGGANPTLANCSLSTNWDPLYSDHREVAGVLIEHNVSTN